MKKDKTGNGKAKGHGRERWMLVPLLLAGMLCASPLTHAAPESGAASGRWESFPTPAAEGSGMLLLFPEALSPFATESLQAVAAADTLQSPAEEAVAESVVQDSIVVETTEIEADAYTEVEAESLQTFLEADTLVETVVPDTLETTRIEADTLLVIVEPDTLSLLDLPEGMRAQLPEGRLYGVPVRDTIQVAFRQGRSTLEEEFEENRTALSRLRSLGSLPLLDKVHIVGSASPEGSVPLNLRLSEERAETISDFLKEEAGLADSLVEHCYIGRDWNRLLHLVEADSLMPYREEETEFLQEVVDSTADGEDPASGNLERLSKMEEGVPYLYMYEHFFPELRRQQCVVQYKIPYIVRCDTLYVPTYVYVHDTTYIEPCRSYYLAVKTNMLMDVGLAPSIGVELYMGKRWSVAAEWSYAWWKSDRRSWYWRTYGGDLAVRKWLGKKSKEKPLQGHHLGVYGQMLTYDYETGGRGYLGDKWSWATGLEYGYSLPIRRRLNIDFAIGVGYMGGEYKEYLPMDGEYVWQVTKERRYFGPTKAEVSLVWLLGCKNTNNGKKGRKR